MDITLELSTACRGSKAFALITPCCTGPLVSFTVFDQLFVIVFVRHL